MADALWISEQTLMDNSVVINSVDFKIITPNIIWVQDEYVQGILGTDLFNSINSMIIAGTLTTALNPLSKTLVDDWVKKVIVNYLLAESAPDMVYRWTNKGIVNKTADNANNISVQELAYISKKFKNRAESYGQRLTDYLVQENANYPLYNANTSYSSIKPKNRNAGTGIYLEDMTQEERRRIHFGMY